MALIEIEEPTPTALRWFGVPFAAFFALAGALIWWRAQAPTAATLVWACAAVVVALYYAVPPLRRALYLGWMYAAYPIGFVMSHVAMAAVYYLVVTPIGLVLRATRRDPLTRELDGQADSYWEPRRRREDPRSYFRQF